MRSVLLIVLLLLNLEAKSFFSNDEQKDNSIYIGNLKELMISTQKTRGLTNSYLHGNTAALLLIYGNRDDIKKAIGKMEATALASDPIINSRATTISKMLIKINNRALKQDAKLSFSQYTEQIGQILMLAQTVSQRNSKDLNPFGKEASTIMMETILPLTEYVGQLRGFGAGLAANGKVVKSDIEKIYLLVSEVTKLNESLQDEMNGLKAKYSSQLPASISDELDSVNKQAKEYTFTAQKKLLKSPQNVNADIYFEEGTSLINAIIKVYNSCNRAVLEDAKGWL